MVVTRFKKKICGENLIFYMRLMLSNYLAHDIMLRDYKILNLLLIIFTMGLSKASVGKLMLHKSHIFQISSHGAL